MIVHQDVKANGSSRHEDPVREMDPGQSVGQVEPQEAKLEFQWRLPLTYAPYQASYKVHCST